MAVKKSLLQKFSKFSQAKKLVIYLVVFALIGGGYMAYQSYALTSDENCAPKGNLNGRVILNDTAVLGLSGGLYKALLAKFNKPYYPTLTVGTTGPCVVKYQRMVNRIMGEKILEEDGKFKTVDSNVTAQIQNWLQYDKLGIDVNGTTEAAPTTIIYMTVNGRVNPITWASINRADEIRFLIRDVLRAAAFQP